MLEKAFRVWYEIGSCVKTASLLCQNRSEKGPKFPAESYWTTLLDGKDVMQTYHFLVRDRSSGPSTELQISFGPWIPIVSFRVMTSLRQKWLNFDSALIISQHI